MKSRILALVTLLVSLFAAATSSAALSVSGGDVPLPVKLVGGTPQVSWNGTYAELLAADALAMCWTTQQDRYLGTASPVNGDALISSLHTKMTAAACRTTCATPPVIDGSAVCPTVDAWLDGRKDPACNINSATGQVAVLDVSRLRAASQTAAYAMPIASALGLTGTDATTSLRNARNEVGYAELSLCMAQLLREKLDTVQVAFASSEDLQQLQEMVRERALTAVYQYSALGKAFASTATAPTAINNPLYFIAPLALWGRGTSNSQSAWQRIGDDFASAIDLLIEATEAGIELRLRDPAAQRSFGKPLNDSVNSFTRLSGPRVEILDTVLYGLGSLASFGSWASAGTPAVVEDMSAPQVGVLLGLARRANALRLKVFNSVFGVYDSASALYANVENALRAEDCARGIASACFPTEAGLVPVSGDMSQYLLWQRFGIDYGHASTLVEALSEAAFGLPPTEALDEPISKTYPRPNLLVVGPGQQRAFHLLGAHSFTGTLPGTPGATATGDVIIDPAFRVQRLRAHDRQSTRLHAQLPAFEIDPAGNGRQQFGDFRFQLGPSPATAAIQGLSVYPVPRPIGSVTALALARESLLQVSALTAANGPRNIYTKAAPILDSIERAIGSRQVIVRQKMTSVAATSSCTGCVFYSPAYTSSTGRYDVRVDIVTKSADPTNHAIVGQGLPLAMSAVLDPAYGPIAGTTQATIRSQVHATLSSVTRGAYQMRSVSSGGWNSSSWAGLSVLLRSGTSNATYKWDHVYTGPLGVTGMLPAEAAHQSNTFGAVVAFGGSFGQTAERAWSFDETRWSSPTYDGFGLPRDWAPAADASLQGSEGVSVERHFIDRAASAAAEATDALQQAFDTLQQEAADDAVLTSSETRAQQLTALELQALCGSANTCVVNYSGVHPGLPNCSGTGPALSFCQETRNTFQKIIGIANFPVEANVVSALQASRAPTFEKFRGGLLQGLLLNQWNAYQGLKTALETAMGTANAAMADYLAAKAETTLANAEFNTVNADVDAGYALLNAQGAGLEAQRAQYQANRNQYDTQVGSASNQVGIHCGEDAVNIAIASGFSYSGEDLDVNSSRTNGWEVWHRESESWSPGAFYAQAARCAEAEEAFRLAMELASPQKVAIQGLIDAIQVQLDALGPQYTALGTRVPAAYARREVAVAREASALAQRGAAVTTAAQSVQGALGGLLSSIVAIDQAFAQADMAAAKIALDQSQTNYDVRTRFGLRKRFRSYDLWRARALTENARRLAVAARRAIESRYVVDLSELRSTEPFVDAPALWADEVFAPDLKPPIALGLTRGPTTASGIYTNKLVDYVDNLKLFLDGFTVQRPTARVRADAEVVQLPGPASQISTSSFDADFSYIDPESRGWSFYCAGSKTWIAHPNASTFSAALPAWQLATACAGKPPALARLGFWLDPWGRVGRSTANPPATARYNVRVGNIAVNLVGTGIHDCSQAADPSACYAEPFVRYGLRQNGPIWVTNYEQAWRALDLPVAVIEDGKGLAIEEWLDPVANGFNRPDVANVARSELHSRPIGGSYELTVELTPEVRVERIERIQILTQTEYWVRQR